MITSPAGFWSYTHQDEVADAGRILRLARSLEQEYLLLTGTDLQLFVDRDGLVWGDAWRTQVRDALEISSFFIPIITPNYFTRVECRKELLDFRAQATSLGASEFLLPIYYVDVLGMSESSTDEAMRLVSGTQFSDWRDLRLEDESSAAHRKAVNGLAKRLVDIGGSLGLGEPNPISPSSPATPPPSGSPPDDFAPGMLEILADGEDALTAWTQVVSQLGPTLETLTEITTELTDEMQESDRKGRGFAGRIAVARRGAARLSPVADAIAELSREYVEALLVIDPSVLLLVRLASELTADSPIDEKAAARQLMHGIFDLAETANEGMTSLSTLVEAISANLNMSKDLRPVFSKMRTGLNSLVDAQSRIDDWHARIEQAGILDAE